MKPKRLPRLWCALQGLLPLQACRVAELGELGWPRDVVRVEPKRRRTGASAVAMDGMGRGTDARRR